MQQPATVETLDRLRAQVRHLERATLTGQELPTHPAIADLLPGGAMRAGAAYSVTNSTTLALALLAGPAAEGAWCGVVGLPTLGLAAAYRLGLDPERLVHVPDAGQLWTTVTASLVDALGVVLVVPATPLAPREAARIAARARERGAALVCLSPRQPWPRSETVLSVVDSVWSGVGAGHGHLQHRLVTVHTRPRHERPRTATLVVNADGVLPRPTSQVELSVSETVPGSIAVAG